GKLNVTGNFAHAISSHGNLTIDGGEYQVSSVKDGLHAKSTLTANSGDINITKSYEGLEGKDKVVINGGNIKIVSSDDAINAGTDLTINNGIIYANCEGDGFDSNGSMTINGGTSTIYASNRGDGALDIGERNAAFTINGGTVFGVGGDMTVAVSDTSKQYSMWINGTFAKDSSIKIGDIETKKIIKDGSVVFYSSSKIKADAKYEVKVGDTSLSTISMTAKNVTLGESKNQMGGGKGGTKGGTKGGMNGGGFRKNNDSSFTAPDDRKDDRPDDSSDGTNSTVEDENKSL
ncbi:MAG: carbohydrate-binding domain-containing protein, partial [Clostridioides sp.]|nr:carbohydrate-binding domain-containing protein [Clostridioides sp.]